MTTGISNIALQEKVERYILKETTRGDMTLLVQDALISAMREINQLGETKPMFWNQEVYDELFTRYYASISAISQADPGVITADSIDPDLSDDHGFQDDDFGYIAGIGGMERLNERLPRLTRASATTITLQTLDSKDDIDTGDYEEYDSGGTIYHAGLVLPASTIQPTDSWTIERVYDVQFDLQPGCEPITEQMAKQGGWLQTGGMPRKWRYQQYTYSTFETDNTEHFLFWYPFPSQKYNIRIFIEKTYPDMSVWDKLTYPPCPAKIHDFIWHRALANLATHAEKQRRRSAGREGTTGDNTKIEILNANYWMDRKIEDEIQILNISRVMSGDQPYVSKGMSA